MIDFNHSKMLLLPTILILMMLAFAWKREWINALLFFRAGIAYIIMAWGQFPWSAHVYIAGPLLLVAYLFWINWQRRKQLRTNG